MVDFLEHQLIAGHVLVKISLEIVNRRTGLEGLPEHGPATPVHQQHGLGPGRFAGIMDLVVRAIGKQCVFRVSAAAGQTTGAGDKQPVVIATDNRHEERGHRVIVGNLVEPLAIPIHRFPTTTRAGFTDRRLPEKQLLPASVSFQGRAYSTADVSSGSTMLNSVRRSASELPPIHA